MIAIILGAVSLTVGCALFLLLAHGLWLTWQSHRRKRCARRLAMPINLSVLKRKDFNDGLFTLTLAHPSGRSLPTYRPGQYLTLLIPRMLPCNAALGNRSLRCPTSGILAVVPPSLAVVEQDENRSSLKRCYSLASWQPKPACYELAIRQVSGGRVSTWLHRNMQSGSHIRVLPPRGEFTLQASSGDVALIAGGIGITPIRDMLHALLAGNGLKQGRIVLFYAARYFDDLLYHEEFIAAARQHANFRYLPILSKPRPDWQGLCGRLDAQTVLHRLDDFSQTDFYLCAGSSMMDAINAGLQKSGIMTERIHFERFNPGEFNAGDTAYRITLEGHQAFEFKGAPTLLHGLEQAKIAVESDCRAGHCGVCRFKVLDGNVRWLLPKETALAEDEILSCCVTPQSDLRLGRP